MNPERLRGGLIGCGFVSRFHLEAWRRVPTAELVALCDRDPDRLALACRRFPEARPYADAETMLAAERLDFVEICTTPESHPELVGLAANRGAHVLCQKPAARSRTELQAMIADCQNAGVRLMIHENWRFRTWNRALKDLIDRGAVGRPIRLRLAHRDTRALRPDGFVDQPYFTAMPRLILFEMGCHLVDLARFLLGEVADVSATVGRFGPGHPGEDVATLSLTFASGALALLDMTWCAPAERGRPEWALNETVVEGTAATLRLQDDGSFLRIGLNGEVEHLPMNLPPADQVYIDGYSATQAHFIDGLLNDTPHATSGEDTLNTMDVVWAGYQSAAERRVIPLLSEEMYGG